MKATFTVEIDLDDVTLMDLRDYWLGHGQQSDGTLALLDASLGALEKQVITPAIEQRQINPDTWILVDA